MVTLRVPDWRLVGPCYPVRMKMLTVAGAALLLGFCAHAQVHWSQFRGPQGNGVAESTNLPAQVSASEGARWKTPVHGRAWSSPVIWGEQIWLTTATKDAKELSALCLDKGTGRILRDKVLFRVAKPQYIHPFNSAASPTPVVEKGRVYVTFGSPGTACIDTASGEVIWERRDIECNHFRGAGSSPILHGDLLILNFDGSDTQFVIALDKATGKTVWKRERSIDFKDLGPNGKPEVDGDYRKAFATCQVIEAGGGPMLISQGSKAVYGYEPQSGKEIWRVEERTSYSGATRPVFGNGVLYVPSGFASGQVLAIRPGAQGETLDAKDAAHTNTTLQVLWRVKKNAPKKPSLLLYNNGLFGLEDNGLLTRWNPENGEVIWSEKLGGHFSASPLGAGGRIYCCSEEGKVVVVSAGKTFAKLSEGEFPDGFMASPAVSGDALFLRTETELYRLEQSASAR